MNDKKTLKITIKTFFGLEEVLREELHELGYDKVEKLNRAVQIEGTWSDVYRLNLLCRCAISILVELVHFRIKNQNDLYRQASQIAWSEWFDYRKTFAVKGTVKSTLFRHTQFPFLVLKDAIVDHFRKKLKERPNVSIDHAQVVLDLHISNDWVTLAINTSGTPLYQRGYRQHTGDAPLNEVLAAGLLRIAQWNPSTPLIDPFCGSGTLLIEATMMASKTPAGIHREHYTFQNLKNYNRETWDTILREAIQTISEVRHANIEIVGGDIDTQMVFKTKRNLNKFAFGRFISVQHSSFEQFQLGQWQKGTMICNPPYGQRINTDDIAQLYEQLGNWMKHQLKGFDCWVLSANSEGMKSIGLKPKTKIKLFNGSLECSFRHYPIY